MLLDEDDRMIDEAVLKVLDAEHYIADQVRDGSTSGEVLRALRGDRIAGLDAGSCGHRTAGGRRQATAGPTVN